MEGRWLTSADVSRRLGVEGGTVRHYAEVLRDLGFPMPREEETGAYLWSPELLEVARVAYAMAKATRGLSFKEAVELILYAGEAAQHARQGRSILTLLHQALQLPGHLEDVVEDLRSVGSEVRRDLHSVGSEVWRDLREVVRRDLREVVRRDLGEAVRRDLEEVVRGYRAGLARSVAEVWEVARKAKDVLRRASSGGWIGPAALLVVALGVFLPALGLSLPASLVATVGLLAVGAYVGWYVGWYLGR